MNGSQLAGLAGCTPARVTQLKKEMLKAGVAIKNEFGKVEFCDQAVDWLKNRPKKNKGRSGTKSRVKYHDRLLKAIQIELDIVPERLFYSAQRIEGIKGWFYVHQGRNVFLGSNFKQALNNISYKSK